MSPVSSCRAPLTYGRCSIIALTAGMIATPPPGEDVSVSGTKPSLALRLC